MISKRKSKEIDQMMWWQVEKAVITYKTRKITTNRIIETYQINVKKILSIES